jgi:hypothetical protein
MTKSKINHPFLVPEDFFGWQEKELMLKMEAESRTRRQKQFLLQITKYAAIIIFAIFLGRESVRFFPGTKDSSDDPGAISVDLVLSQVSEEDITNYFINYVTEDVIH